MGGIGEGRLKKKTLVLGGILLVVLAAGLGFFWPFGKSGDILRLPGIVEVQEVRLGSKVSGRVKELVGKSGSPENGSNLEGEIVEAGQPLVIFDIPELEAQYKQAAARMDTAQADYDKAKITVPLEVKIAKEGSASAKARFDRAKAGPRKEEKEQAASDLETAQAELKQALEDYDRIRALYEKRSVSRAEYDAALSTRGRARGKVNAAQERVKLMKKYRQEDIDEAQAEWLKAQAKWKELERTQNEDIALAKTRWQEAKAKVEELDANRKEAVVYAPKKARVDVISVRKGDLISPNQPIARLLYLEDLWIKAYVPETELRKIHYGQLPEVEVLIDGTSKRFKGKVYYISPISEFTPRNVQSVDERHHQVFAIKIRVDNSEDVFHSGMAAEVLLPVKEP
jgi:multidrug resistance efflux pump